MSKQVIWITGASSGIGKGLALEYAREVPGISLVLTARRKEVLDEVASECRALSAKVLVLPCDLEKYENGFQKEFDAVMQTFHKLDVLILNAGLGQRSLARDTKVEVDERLMKMNYVSQVALAKTVLPYFRQNRKGQYAVVTSVTGMYETPFRSGYAASKHALHGFFDSLRAEESDQGISVTLLAPGFVQTDLTLGALTGDGSGLGYRDHGNANGLTPEVFAARAIRAISKKKKLAVIGGLKETSGYYVKRFFPSLFAYAVKKVRVR